MISTLPQKCSQLATGWNVLWESALHVTHKSFIRETFFYLNFSLVMMKI